MHKTGGYIDLRIVFTHSFEHEIPNLVFNLVSLEKKFGAIVNWVLNHTFNWMPILNACPDRYAAAPVTRSELHLLNSSTWT